MSGSKVIAMNKQENITENIKTNFAHVHLYIIIF